MDIPFAAFVSPTGCYSVSAKTIYTQMDAQSYHREPRQACERAYRERVTRRILESQRLTPSIRATIEAYLHTHARIADWHILRDDRRDAAVKMFYEDVWRLARAKLKVMALCDSDSASSLSGDRAHD